MPIDATAPGDIPSNCFETSGLDSRRFFESTDQLDLATKTRSGFEVGYLRRSRFHELTSQLRLSSLQTTRLVQVKP